MKLYLIPGTGADERMFENLNVNCEVVHFEPIIWKGEATLENYAKQLSAQVDTSGEYGFLGVSFGGMVAVELAKLMDPLIVFVVSSARNYKDLPPIIRVASKLGGKAIVTPWTIRNAPFAASLMGFKKKNKRLFNMMLDNTSDLQLVNAVKAIMSWRGVGEGDHIHQIHGSKDWIIPIRRLDDPIVIDNGSHFMVYRDGKELSRIVNDLLSKAQKKTSKTGL